MNTDNQTSPTIRTTLMLGATALLISACAPSEETSNSAPSEVVSAVAAYQLAEAPAGALSVADARKQAKPGEAIQVSGQIGGTLSPFIDGYAGFVLADPKIDFCDEMGDDHCSTPWDACCEDPDKLQAMRLSVQFVDSSGNPIQEDLKSTVGLKELDIITVTGIVDNSSSDTNIIVNATGLYAQ